MRKIVLTLVFLSAALRAAAATTVVTNQPPVYADREVSQDAVVAGCGSQTRIVNVELAFTATPSNNVQIAFGSDLDNDGRLSFGEVRMTLRMPMRLNAGGVPLSLAFADGNALFTFDGFTEMPSWMRPREWSMLRLTARGWDGRDGQAAVKMSPDGNVITLR